MLSGSCSARTLEQIAEAERVMSVLHLDPEPLVASDGDVSHVLAWTVERLHVGPVLISASADPARVKAVQQRHGAERTSEIIENALARLSANLFGLATCPDSVERSAIW